MKKWMGWKICLAVCLIAGLVITPLFGPEVYAAETTTVQGTVASGTTAELLM